MQQVGFFAGGIAQFVASTPRTVHSRNQLPGGARAFSIVKTLGLWAHSDAIHSMPGAPSLCVKRSGQEDDQSSPSGAEVKNVRNCSPTRPTRFVLNFTLQFV